MDSFRSIKRVFLTFVAALVIALPAEAATSSVVSVGTSATQVVAAGAGQSAALQNVGTAVIFCGFSSAVTTAANYFVALKAGAGAADGSGGSVAFKLGYGVPVHCIVAAATQNVAVVALP